MKINGTQATANEELKVWESELKSAKKENNLSWISVCKEKVEELNKLARIERMLNKLDSI